MMRLIACINADGNLAGFKPPSADLKRFAALTMKGTVVMGSKTWGAMPAFVKPLHHRHNVIVTSTPKHLFADRFPGAQEKHCGDWSAYPWAWVIGGGEIYAMAMPLVQRIYLSTTRDHGGSVPFPIGALNQFEQIVKQDHGDHTFQILERLA